MLYQFIRMVDATSGSNVDASLNNQDEASSVIFDLDSDKYVYVGKHYPFNNFFIKMGSNVNSEAAALKIEYWGGESNEWNDAVDIIDGTYSGGATLAQSGAIQFSPDRLKVWNNVSDTSLTSGTPSELQDITMYNLYWIRLSSTAALTANTEVERLAYAFTTSQQLNNIDIQINSYLTSFGAGKTDWIDEILTASSHVVSDMKRKGLIVDEGAILKLEDVSLPTDWYTLSLIYYSLGPSFKDQRQEALRMYSDILNKARLSLDKDKDGLLDEGEIHNRVSTVIR